MYLYKQAISEILLSAKLMEMGGGMASVTPPPIPGLTVNHPPQTEKRPPKFNQEGYR